jgi:hypothetical protein
MFQVFDNGRPADCNNHKVHPTWNKSMYDSFEEAQQYCHQWLGEYANCTPLKPNQKINYSGWGDTIEIREVSTRLSVVVAGRDKIDQARIALRAALLTGLMCERRTA